MVKYWFENLGKVSNYKNDTIEGFDRPLLETSRRRTRRDKGDKRRNNGGSRRFCCWPASLSIRTSCVKTVHFTMKVSVAAFAACAVMCTCILTPTEAFLPGSSAFAGANAKLSLRAARGSVSHVPDFLRLPKLRTSAHVANALRMAISDESMISTSGGAGGFFT